MGKWVGEHCCDLYTTCAPFVLQCEKLKELITKVRNMLANKDNEAPETIKTTVNELQQASLKLFEVAYKKVSRALCA